MGKPQKRPRVPKYEEKKLLSANKLDWKHWLYLEEDDESITFISKASGRKRVLMK